MGDEESAEAASEFATTDLYVILGLERDATFEEIKKAYRKRALETHPDRGGNIEEFKRLAKAKDVLSDPQKRNYYDVYGEDGVAFFDQWQSADPNEMLAQVGWGGIVCFCISNLICVAFVLCFPVFLIVRQDDWMWGWMMAPIWVIDAIVLLMLAITPLLPYNMHSQRELLSSCMWTEILQMICFITWQVFVSVNLDHSGWMDWIAVFVPMFVFQAITTIKQMVESLPEHYEVAARTKAPGAVCGHPIYCIYLGVQQALWWCAWILIPLRMDQTVDVSWWLVATPLFVLIGFGLFAATRDPHRARNQDEMEEVVYEQVFSRWKFAAWLFALATTITVCLYVSEAVETGIYFIFLPLFIVAAAFVIAICYTSASLIGKDSPFAETQSSTYENPESCEVGEDGYKEDDHLLDPEGPAPGAEYGGGVRTERPDPNVYD